MNIISKQTKKIINIIFVCAIIVAIIYVFKDSLPQIIGELKKTSTMTLLLICASSAIYEAIEGWVSYSFAKKYNNTFTYKMALTSVYYASFYRVATLGSAGGVAAIHYFREHGIPVSKGTGFYTLGYALHKAAIAVFSMLTVLLTFTYITTHFKQYSLVLIAGYAIMLLITVGLVLFCCSRRFHVILMKLVGKCNRKGRFDCYVLRLQEECQLLEEASKSLMSSPLFVLKIICMDLLKNFFWFVIPFIVLYPLGQFTLLEALAVTSLGVVLAAVVPTPAGIGGIEYILTTLLAVFVGTGPAGSATLLYRFATFLFPFLVGAVIVIYRKSKFLRK